MLRMVDEYLTSRTDSVTEEPLVNMKAWSTKNVYKDGKVIDRKRTYSKVHKVLHCKSNVMRPHVAGQQTTWNRDVNAALNILKLLKLDVAWETRPACYCRKRQLKRQAKKQSFIERHQSAIIHTECGSRCRCSVAYLRSE